MAEPNGTADIEKDDVPPDDEEDVWPDDEEAEDVAADEAADAEPPRRRLVSELLEGEDELGQAPADLQLVATPDSTPRISSPACTSSICRAVNRRAPSWSPRVEIPPLSRLPQACLAARRRPNRLPPQPMPRARSASSSHSAIA